MAYSKKLDFHDTSKRSLISVVIPAYNSSVFIRETLDSVHTQGVTNFDLEAIVVDDGSTDTTAEIAMAAGAFVIRKKNGGVASSRNTGLRAARGGYILFLDGDDRLRPDALSVLGQALLENPHQGAVFAQAQDFICPSLPAEEKALLRPRESSYFGLLTGCMLIRKEALDQVGPFDEVLKTGEAVEWLLRMQDLRVPSMRRDFISADRRLHMSNTGRLHPEQERKDYANILRERLKSKGNIELLLDEP